MKRTNSLISDAGAFKPGSRFCMVKKLKKLKKESKPDHL